MRPHPDFLVVDSQELSTHSGGRYDLIHVDGRQQGEGPVHDLTLATNQTGELLMKTRRNGGEWPSRTADFSRDLYPFELSWGEPPRG